MLRVKTKFGLMLRVIAIIVFLAQWWKQKKALRDKAKYIVCCFTFMLLSFWPTAYIDIVIRQNVTVSHSTLKNQQLGKLHTKMDKKMPIIYLINAQPQISTHPVDTKS